MLTVCPTPIGNLEDVTARQMRALQDADIIACEDSRTTGKLLEMLGISRANGKPELISYHEHNAEDRAEQLVTRMLNDTRVTLVSDAGTPTISDPGYRLVSLCHARDIPVTALPGPAAAIVAMSASGLPSNRFLFEGFLPAKEAARRQRLTQLQALGITTILYESPHKLLKTLRAIDEVFGSTHPISLGRELTKLHEEIVTTTVTEAIARFEARDRVRGEFVLVLAPGTADADALDDDALAHEVTRLLAEGHRTKTIRDMLSTRTSYSSSELYEQIEQIKKNPRSP